MTSFYSRIIYYATGRLRDEPRNMGVVVWQPETNFAKGRFNLENACPNFDEGYEILEDWIIRKHGTSDDEYEWRAASGATMDINIPLESVREYQERLERTMSTIQWKKPCASVRAPQELLDALYDIYLRSPLES